MKKTMVVASVSSLWLLASVGLAHTQALPKPCVMGFSASVPMLTQASCGQSGYAYTDKVVNYTRETLNVYIETPDGFVHTTLGPHSVFAYPDFQTYQYKVWPQDGRAVFTKGGGQIFDGSVGYYNIPSYERWVVDNRVLGDSSSGYVAQSQEK